MVYKMADLYTKYKIKYSIYKRNFLVMVMFFNFHTLLDECMNCSFVNFCTEVFFLLFALQVSLISRSFRWQTELLVQIARMTNELLCSDCPMTNELICWDRSDDQRAYLFRSFRWPTELLCSDRSDDQWVYLFRSFRWTMSLFVQIVP